MTLPWLDQELLSRKIIFITGKGGIGKTFLAATLAKRAVGQGRRVLLVEQSFVGQLGPLVGFERVQHDEIWVDRLGVANFTAAGNFRDFITKHLLKSGLLDVLISNKIVHSFFTAIPGFAELMLLGRLYYALNLAPNKPDLIIVDGYASGHFLSLMTTPDAVLKSGLAGPIALQTKKVRDWLSNDSDCVTYYVGVPEDLVVSEAIEFIPLLMQKSPVRLGGIIMNRCLNLGSSTLTSRQTRGRDFIAEKVTRQANALKVLSKWLQETRGLQSLPLIILPELGAVDEPLSDLVVEKIFKKGMQYDK